MSLKVIAIFLLLSRWTSGHPKSLKEVFSWKVLDYVFPTEADRQSAIDDGSYIKNAGFPIDVDVHYKSDGTKRVFTTIPRFAVGIPYTLGTVSDENGPNGPKINPYPSFKWHYANNTECTGIISAFRVAIDECNQMWVIDSGIVANVQVCPPQLLTFDLNTDKLIHRYQFTTDVYVPTASLFITPIVDIRDPPPSGRCQNAMVYIADSLFFGLVVYDFQANVTWRIRDKRMYPDPSWGTLTIGGESFDQMGGIFAINLTPRIKPDGSETEERFLYFHALASQTEIAVPLNLIDNRTIWQKNQKAEPNAFKVIGKRGVQSVMETIDSKGNLFASTNDPVRVFYWNVFSSNSTYDSNKNVVTNNQEQLQFGSGMKTVKNPDGPEELWVCTSRYQKFALGTLDPNDINYRIMFCEIDDLLKNKIYDTNSNGNIFTNGITILEKLLP